MQAGADAAEAYVQEGVHRLVRVSDAVADFVKESRVRGLGLRLVVGGRRSFVHSADVRDESLPQLAESAARLARLAPEDPWAPLPAQGFASASAHELQLYDESIAALRSLGYVE